MTLSLGGLTRRQASVVMTSRKFALVAMLASILAALSVHHPASADVATKAPPSLIDVTSGRRRLQADIVNGTSPFDPNTYAYLIIHYDKTGHHLSRSLQDILVAGTDGAPVSNNRENAFHLRDHEEATGCPAMELVPGVVHVQAAPDFFCDTNLLAEYLLRNGDIFHEKRGIKVVHLVRNPFDWAVSNWVHHMHHPMAESGAKTVDLCTPEVWHGRQTLGDLVAPALSVGEDPIMRREDFDALNQMCMDISGKETSLRHLEPEAALSLATTHMLAQGRTSGDIVRMANNIVRLRQVQQLEDHVRVSQHLLQPKPEERMVQVMTLSTHEFLQDPRATTLRFLDFALGDASPPEAKLRIATEYDRSYLEKVRMGDEHITSDKDEKKAQLEGCLRQNELFGRVLGKVERLVADALQESGIAI